MTPRLRSALLIAVLLLVVPVSAHTAGFVESDPAPGATATSDTLRVATAVPLTDAFLLLEAVGPGGAIVTGPARLDPRDPQAILAPVRRRVSGGHAVRWRGLGQDGSVVGGAFTYSVAGAGVPAPPVASPIRGGVAAVAVARGLALLGPIVALGLVLLRWWVVAPVALDGGIRPPRRGDRRDGPGERGLAVPDGAWWAAWWSALVVGGVGLLASPFALAWRLRSWDVATLLAVRPGAALVVQAAALVLAALMAVAVARRPVGRVWALALGLPPAAALAAVSASGHAWVEPDRTVAVGADLLHNWAAAAWIGGLVGLLVLVAPWLARLPEPDRVPVAAGVVVRFSTLAIAAVVMLVATGTYRALAELGAPADLLDTGYGVALSVKLALFAVLLVTGGYNRLVLHPRLERAALGLRDGDGGAATALRTSVAAELALVGALMVAVAVMVAVLPPS